MDAHVFNRTESDCHETRISANLYNLLIGLVLCWGFVANWIMVKTIPYESIASINPLVFIIGYFVCCFSGIAIISRSSVPVLSFIGYNMIVVPFGLIINLAVARYDGALVTNAIRVTGLVTFIMMMLGSMFPAFFRKIAGALGVALIAVILVWVVEIFLLKTHFGFLDWAIALIFCGYIGVDWGRANAIPKTVDNAIDSAAALYIDIINLFLAILRIMGRK